MKTGFELEFTADVLSAESYKHGRFYNYVMMLMEESNIFDWRLDDDASCGNELVSPPLEESEGLAQVMQVCHCVKTAQEKFNLQRIIGADTGVHFHFDATDLVKKSQKSVKEIRNILLLSAILEPLWYSMNPGARFDTAFAAPLNFNMYQMVRARDMTDIRDIWFRPYMGVNCHSDSYRIKNNRYLPKFINDDTCAPEKYDWTRYHGFNLVAMFKHGTFEFRYTHGSFDPTNIELWFTMYKQVVEAARKMSTKDIIRRCPVNIDSIKMNCIDGLQHTMYADLKLAIHFLFEIIPQDVQLLRFILAKIIKYSPASIPPNVALQIFDYEGDFKGLLALLNNTQIVSGNYHRNRYGFTPNNYFEEDVPPPNYATFDEDEYPAEDEDEY